MSDRASTAYLFQRNGEDLFAVSHDGTGSNIPRTTCTLGWTFTKKFRLGVCEPVPARVMPESILRGIATSGYFIWRGSSSRTAR